LVSFFFKNSSQGLGLLLTIEGGGIRRWAACQEGGGELGRRRPRKRRRGVEEMRSGRRRRGIEKTEAERRDTSGGGRRKMGHTHEQSHGLSRGLTRLVCQYHGNTQLSCSSRVK
jgi:hypothetical protein